jgi:hypothetical protein
VVKKNISWELFIFSPSICNFSAYV